MDRRDFVKTTVQGVAVATTPRALSAQPASLDNEKILLQPFTHAVAAPCVSLTSAASDLLTAAQIAR